MSQHQPSKNDPAKCGQMLAAVSQWPSSLSLSLMFKLEGLRVQVPEPAVVHLLHLKLSIAPALTTSRSCACQPECRSATTLRFETRCPGPTACPAGETLGGRS